MENDKSKIVTFEDLAKYTKEVVSPLINENLVKFAEDTLLPSIEQMFDDFRVEVDEKLKPINQGLVNIQAEMSDIKSEISAIKGRLNQIEIRLERLEKMVDGDSRMVNAEITELKQANQEITKRLTFLESKQA